MAKKKTAPKKKTTRTKKPAAKVKKAKKAKKLSPHEQKMEVIAEFLQEIYHLTSHSVEAGTEGSSPWHQIMETMIFIHNQQESNQEHLIQEIRLAYEGSSQETRILPPEIHHDCED